MCVGVLFGFMTLELMLEYAANKTRDSTTLQPFIRFVAMVAVLGLWWPHWCRHRHDHVRGAAMVGVLLVIVFTLMVHHLGTQRWQRHSPSPRHRGDKTPGVCEQMPLHRMTPGPCKRRVW